MRLIKVSLVYVLAGQGTVGSERRPIRKGQLAVFGPGDTIRTAASTSQPQAEPNLDVLVIGGRPIREPIAMAGPFAYGWCRTWCRTLARTKG